MSEGELEITPGQYNIDWDNLEAIDPFRPKTTSISLGYDDVPLLPKVELNDNDSTIESPKSTTINQTVKSTTINQTMKTPTRPTPKPTVSTKPITKTTTGTPKKPTLQEFLNKPDPVKSPLTSPKTMPTSSKAPTTTKASPSCQQTPSKSSISSPRPASSNATSVKSSSSTTPAKSNVTKPSVPNKNKPLVDSKYLKGIDIEQKTVAAKKMSAIEPLKKPRPLSNVISPPSTSSAPRIGFSKSVAQISMKKTEPAVQRTKSDATSISKSEEDSSSYVRKRRGVSWDDSTKSSKRSRSPNREDIQTEDSAKKHKSRRHRSMDKISGEDASIMKLSVLELQFYLKEAKSENKHLKKKMTEQERKMKYYEERIKEMELEIAELQVDKSSAIEKERDNLLKELKSTKAEYNDLKRLHAFSTDAIKMFRNNEIELRRALKLHENSYDQLQMKYDELKEHAQIRLREAFEEIQTRKKEMLKQTDEVTNEYKKSQWTIKILEEKIEKLEKENQQIRKYCSEYQYRSSVFMDKFDTLQH